MAEKSEDSTKYLIILVTGLVSLVVGVVSALLINYLTEKRLVLSYDITSIEVFEGKTQKIGLIALQVINSGSREIEDIQCRVVLSEAELTEPRSSGIPPSAITVNHTKTDLDAKISFLNAGESFSLQMLVEPLNITLPEPNIEIRGKGVVGVRKGKEKELDTSLKLFMPISASLMTILTVFVTLFVLRSRRGMGSPFSDNPQRDEFAYLLGINGFVTEANFLRDSNRNHTYWALSDMFTERILSNNAKEPEVLKRGARVLEQLIDYSSGMAAISKAIIKLNAARLASLSGDEQNAVELLKSARSKHKTIVEQRLKIDASLKTLDEQSKDS